jgi:DNA-binding FadR family transcriptional regulator
MVTIDVDNAGTSTAAWHKDICFIAKNKLLISINELIARNFRRHSSIKKTKANHNSVDYGLSCSFLSNQNQLIQHFLLSITFKAPINRRKALLAIGG